MAVYTAVRFFDPEIGDMPETVTRIKRPTVVYEIINSRSGLVDKIHMRALFSGLLRDIDPACAALYVGLESLPQRKGIFQEDSATRFII